MPPHRRPQWPMPHTPQCTNHTHPKPHHTNIGNPLFPARHVRHKYINSNGGWFHSYLTSAAKTRIVPFPQKTEGCPPIRHPLLCLVAHQLGRRPFVMPFGIQAFESDKTAANVAEFAKVMMGSFFQAESILLRCCFLGGRGKIWFKCQWGGKHDSPESPEKNEFVGVTKSQSRNPMNKEERVVSIFACYHKKYEKCVYMFETCTILPYSSN